MNSVLNKLTPNLAEQAKLVSQLRMWARVQEQGIDPETVSTFTLWEPFLTKQQQTARNKERLHTGIDPLADDKTPKFYNAVRLKDGTLTQLDPMIPRPL